MNPRLSPILFLKIRCGINNTNTVIPITPNTLYTKESEKVLDDCLKELIHNYEQAQKPKGEVFAEQVQNVG